MSVLAQTNLPEIEYPESDGKPMADNMTQYRWITIIREGLNVQLPDLVAADLFWYPVQGRTDICQSPDVFVALGRSKEDRRSYQQWLEGNVAPQVVFEIVSKSNTWAEMTRKQQFYQRHGVEEYYVYDPNEVVLTGQLRRDGKFVEIDSMDGWVSPLLGIRFEMTADGLAVYHPDGERFLSFEEIVEQRNAERQRAETERQRAEAEKRRADDSEALAARLAEKLRALGVDPDQP